MRENLRRRLVELGASHEDLERAEAQGWLPLLALDQMLLPGKPTYDVRALTEVLGVDEETLRQLWRALGFPDVPSDVALFGERDVAAARLLFAQAAADDIDLDLLLQRVRVISASMARIAAVEAEALVAVVRRLGEAGVSDDDVALGLLESGRFSEIAELIDYLNRVQVRAAAWRQLALAADPEIVIGIGFADLAGYTKLTAHLDSSQLSTLIGTWERIAFDTLAAHGTRVVKTIGDEVMFVGLPAPVAEAALALRDAAREAGLPPLRVGLAAGPVVARDGDYYGPVVNLASRLTDLAHPDEVLAAGSLAEVLGENSVPGVHFGRRGIHRVRSIGEVEIYEVQRAG